MIAYREQYFDIFIEMLIWITVSVELYNKLKLVDYAINQCNMELMRLKKYKNRNLTCEDLKDGIICFDN